MWNIVYNITLDFSNEIRLPCIDCFAVFDSKNVEN